MDNKKEDFSELDNSNFKILRILFKAIKEEEEIPLYLFENEVKNESFSRKKHINIWNSSTNYFSYFYSIENFVFDSIELEKFTSILLGKWNDLTKWIDIKEINKLEYYYNQIEKKEFKEIDDSWINKKYRDVVRQSYELLNKLGGNILGRQFTSKKKIPEEWELIYSKLIKNIKNGKNLKKKINDILKIFLFLRNNLKNQVPVEDTQKEVNKEFNELDKIEKKLYLRLEIDMLKTFHNFLMLLSNENEIKINTPLKE